MPPVELRFVVPDEHKGGTYADMVGVWHNQHGFTLDFASLDRAKAIADNVAKYEQRYGPITPPPSDEPSPPPGGADQGGAGPEPA